jgi:DNA-binding Lrp family transcriptional regulator
VQAQIIKALEAAGRLSTRDLAVRLGAGRDRVYKCCKQLEKEGRLTSELIKAGEKSIYFFPMTKEVVTSENYERIGLLNDAIAETVRAFSLPGERDRLAAALELRFERLAEGLGGVGRGALEEFAAEMVEIVARADKRADIMSHLGIRPMRPPARVWALGQQLSLT